MKKLNRLISLGILAVGELFYSGCCSNYSQERKLIECRPYLMQPKKIEYNSKNETLGLQPLRLYEENKNLNARIQKTFDECNELGIPKTLRNLGNMIIEDQNQILASNQQD